MKFAVKLRLMEIKSEIYDFLNSSENKIIILMYEIKCILVCNKSFLSKIKKKRNKQTKNHVTLANTCRTM